MPVVDAHGPADRWRGPASVPGSEATPLESRRFPGVHGNRLTGVKWHNWKMHLVCQVNMYDPPVVLPEPKVINLLTDLKEERDVAVKPTWVLRPMLQMVKDWEESLAKYPPIKAGTPDPYTPAVKR